MKLVLIMKTGFINGEGIPVTQLVLGKSRTLYPSIVSCIFYFPTMFTIDLFLDLTHKNAFINGSRLAIFVSRKNQRLNYQPWPLFT